MQDLSQHYLERLEQIAQAIQGSEEYGQFMETEEEAEYKALQDAYEPHISRLHTEVAANDPLQLITFETIVRNDAFEGLFLPKVLGYSVLRGQISPLYKYTRPQNHFRDTLLAICESSNFEFIKKRIGQTVQMGFALSSDIWITDLINSLANKRLRYYLQGSKLDRFRDPRERADGYKKYARQFIRENFHSAAFPTTFAELKVEYPDLKHFLMYRVSKEMDNSSLNPHIVSFIENPELKGTPEHIQVMCLANHFIHLSETEQAQSTAIFNELRAKTPGFVEHYLEFLLEMHEAGLPVDAKAETKASGLVDKSYPDKLTEYYQLADLVHTKGYNQPEVMEAVKAFYNSHEGLSTVNSCIRQMIYAYLGPYIIHLEEREYRDYFKISDVFIAYMHIFSNQHFNQRISDISLDYFKKLLVYFTDKRGRDYQDIKKFVSTVFVDLKFVTEKDVVEMFKTRRKKKEGV